ncbi:hypothetical protein PG995_008170 [Apiospora arundinis]
MDKIRDFDESKVDEDLQTVRGLLTTPPLFTNPRLEEVARIAIRSAEEARQHRDEGGNAVVIPSTAYTAAWDRYKHARSALEFWRDRSSRNESAVRDLKAMGTWYLASKYGYHLHKAAHDKRVAFIQTPEVGPSKYLSPEKEDTVASMLWDLDSHLQLERRCWSKLHTSLQEDLKSLKQWETGDSDPKSKAPPTPTLTWMMEILSLFEEKAKGSTMLAVHSAATNESGLYDKMCNRHLNLVRRMRTQVALDEVDKDIASIAVWVPKMCDTTLLERAMRYHKLDIMRCAASIK